MATQREIMEICGFMAAAFPQFQLKKATIDIYAELLADLDTELLSVAAKQAVAEGKFFPAVSELRDRVLALRNAVEHTPDAAQAWGELMHEVRRVGYMSWTEARFSTELIADVARIFWHDACLVDIDSMPTIRAQFRDAYNGRVNRQHETARRLPETNDMIKRLAESMSLQRRLSMPGNGHRREQQS